MKSQTTTDGFTLLEMLLVMTIIAGIMLGIATYSQQKMLQLREDRTVLQIQQILNAGLAFYLNNMNWPSSLAQLQGDTTSTNPGGYLPGPNTVVTISNPWASGYIIGNSASSPSATNAALFAVCTTINAGKITPSVAAILAARLPMAYVVNGDVSANCDPSAGLPLPTASACTAAPCTVIATVNIPGQNLNNARSVNFAGIYHHGACVAAPKCPAGMSPQIFLAPVSVSGMNSSTSEVFPIHSFTAYYSSSGLAPNPSACYSTTYYEWNNPTCPGGTGVASPGDMYWRVCLQIITSNGQVVYNSSTAVAAATILAITRCSPTGEGNEPGVAGSTIDVFGY